jgi:hypothetical protein
MIRWPEDKSFAFTIFDDPDAQSEEDSRRVYEFLAELGFRTTKGVWPLGPSREPNSGGETCATASYLRHCQELQQAGFEMGFHNATCHSATRTETIDSLDRFREYFGHDPSTMANHYNAEAIYWGPARLTGKWRSLYNALTFGKNVDRHFGERDGHPMFWGDICRQRIRYCRNFAYVDINTLRRCPYMPYVDPLRPFVRAWYASTEGANRDSFVRAVSEANQDRLEREGGACVMYTHFGHGFVREGKLDPKFVDLMRRMSRKNGWFVPAATLLDHLATQQGITELDPARRNELESRWLWEKLFRGTS